MAADALSPAQLKLLVEIATPLRYEYTGCGYFLTVTDESFPEERRTLCEPAVVGVNGDVRAGFIVFLGRKELTLECHTWGSVDVPEDFRELAVAISAPQTHVVNIEDAT
jgi:hypothetical protein